MKRGDIVWVDFDPVRRSEAAKKRPAVVVSNDGANDSATRLGRGVVTVVPITSNVTRIYSFQVSLPARRCHLKSNSKAQAERIRAVSFERVGAVISSLPQDLLHQLDSAIRLHLGV